MADIIETSYRLLDDDAGKKPSLILAAQTGLSQAVIKDAMQKGALWLLRGSHKQRLRRAGKKLVAGDELQFFYNAQILAQQVIEPMLVADEGQYSIWFKPYGLACQGSRWGDFSAINRWVEQYWHNNAASHGGSGRPVFLVHRLDRATSGLILLAHSKQAAQRFSAQFEQHTMDKRYKAIVQGDFSAFHRWHEVTEPIDGKPASTLFQWQSSADMGSLVDIRLNTGRKHQIRRHLQHLGFPIIGDRLYGQAGIDDIDLQLQAYFLGFNCPFTQVSKHYEVPAALRLL